MLARSQVGAYSCGADANGWIESWFGDCVYTPWEATSFFIGLSSVCFWLIAQLPQFISNFIRSAADALSPWFLAQWLAGDTFNFLGCVLTGDQLKTQTITAGYFIFSDIVIITQYVYYQIRNRKAIDFDESVHKGTVYSSTLTGTDNIDSALEEAEGFKGSEDNLADAPIVAAFADTDEGSKRSKYPLIRTSDKGNAGHTEPSSGMHLSQALLTRVHSDVEQKDGWMVEHRHRLRRLVQEYNLECGHRVAMQFTLLFKSMEKYRNNQPRRVPVNSVRTKKVGKAMLGIVGLFGVVSVANSRTFSAPGTLGNSVVGLPLGRRALLATYHAGAIRQDKSSFTKIVGPTMAHVASHLVPLSQRTFPWTTMIGRFLGWGSSALYLGSRVSQLLKNKQRRSADGLSLGMVICAVLANVTYGLSIIMRTPSWDNLIGKAPWLVGSFGTVFLDLFIFIQAHYYSWHSKKGEPNKYTPLLS